MIADISSVSSQPWHVTYKRHQSGAVMKNTFFDRNANIQVMDEGLYEILAVSTRHKPIAQSNNYFS